MAEKIVRTGEEIVQYILDTAEKKKIPISTLSKMSNISVGCISRWNQADPRTSKVLATLSSLEVGVMLIDTSSELDRVFSAFDSEYLKELGKISIDAKILYVITKILKEPNLTVSDKERLCKVLESFI